MFHQRRHYSSTLYIKQPPTTTSFSSFTSWKPSALFSLSSWKTTSFSSFTFWKSTSYSSFTSWKTSSFSSFTYWNPSIRSRSEGEFLVQNLPNYCIFSSIFRVIVPIIIFGFSTPLLSIWQRIYEPRRVWKKYYLFQARWKPSKLKNVSSTTQTFSLYTFWHFRWNRSHEVRWVKKKSS